MKFKKLAIKNFRHVHDQEIFFGNEITAIAWQNSTWKTSLLWWLAQACKYKWSEKTVIGKNFQENYSEIFRFCSEQDFWNVYEVELFYDEKWDISSKKMKTRHLPETQGWKERYKIDYYDENKKTWRWRALDFPIIYLWLKRLIPLATEKSVASSEDIIITKKEKRLYSKLSKDILILLDEKIDSEWVKSTNKNILAMKTDKYGHLWNSAGQDNIWQIITSLISFDRLKEKQWEWYKWGVLLIDEIDATLYAWSQIKLIKTLVKFAKTHSLQVVFTTHSLEILEFLSTSSQKDDNIKINFLELKDWIIVNEKNPAIQSIKNKIKVQIWSTTKKENKDFLCEDNVTKLWFSNLLNWSKYKKLINISSWPLWDGILAELAESKNKLFKHIYFVLDWDCSKKYKEKKLPPRTILLPGSFRPESIFYDYLKWLSDYDEFWNEEDNFTKQTCFNDYQTDTHQKGIIKKWFKDERFAKHFGRGYSKLFNRRKKDNEDLIKDFYKQIEEIL